jgi:hypothetical protein
MLSLTMSPKSMIVSSNWFRVRFIFFGKVLRRALVGRPPRRWVMTFMNPRQSSRKFSWDLREESRLSSNSTIRESFWWISLDWVLFSAREDSSSSVRLSIKFL